MTAFVLVIAATAFLAGAATAAFVTIVVGIRKVDRPRTRPPAGTSMVDTVTRRTLAAGTWPNGPALGDRKHN